MSALLGIGCPSEEANREIQATASDDRSDDMAVRLRRLKRKWVHLNENALTRAIVSGVDDIALIARRYPGKAARASRIIAGNSGFHDVRNAVFKLQKYVLAVINTEPVARTKVLVDPDTHVVERTDSHEYRDIRT